MSDSFVHLHLHSEFSLIDGIVRIDPLIDAAAEQNMPAVALTDHHNLFAAVKFYRAAIKQKIKPIFGAEITIIGEDEQASDHRLVLLCQDKTGYLNLTQLISKAYVEGQVQGVPTVRIAWLKQHHQGLIALSAAQQGNIGQSLAKQLTEQALTEAKDWQAIFGDRFYIELQRHGLPSQEHYIEQVVNIAEQLQIPVVATNDVRFLVADDFEAHEARVCIHDGYVLADNKRPSNYTAEQFLRSPQQMQALFADYPEALTNSALIAKRCNVKLELGTPYLPNFPIPDGFTIDTYLQKISEQGLQQRLQRISAKAQPYHDRLALELNVISDMGFSGYFLIVADFIQWAKQNNIPVGPGRGSGAGSLVAYALQITDLDPLQYELLFERFLNPERVSMPDFDIDFCMEGRDRVIEYVAQKYGRDSVSQIITFGTMAAKAVVRDVGRVLGHPYGFVDKIAKLIPFEIGMTLEKALHQEQDLWDRYQQEEDVKNLIDLAKKLEGITRNAGKHAGGVVIAPSQLTDFTPLYCEAGGKNLVTQFDKDDVEAVGLVKFDFLGLRTLTIINWALQTINQHRQQRQQDAIDIAMIPTDDSASFDLLKATNTTAVFQLESRGMKDLIHRLQPDCFEEIIALVALFRPGPLQSGMVDDFIDRKHGRAAVEYPHPDLEAILKPTYGVILYQEQVMQIAQVLAGYTLGAADLLRRAMGKKKPEEMAKQRSIFIEGALKRGVEEKTATSIFDLMEKFAGYGFNKSHSAAYALVAYQTAWLKAHYPAAFMAAVLSSDMDNTDKVVTFIDDTRENNIEILPPSVQHSQYKFTMVSKQQIRYGLGAIKGVGEAAIDNIVENRGEGYQDLFDFCRRVDGKKINRRVLEALISSGAMDGLGPNRASMMVSLEKALKLAEQHLSNQSSGQGDLFAVMETSQDTQPSSFAIMPAWNQSQRLRAEKETLGLYLTGHPYDEYRDQFSGKITTAINQLQAPKNSIRIAGLIVALRKMFTKRGDRMAFITLDDGTGRVEIAIFSDQFNESKEIINKDELIMVEGEVSHDEYTGGLRMRAHRLTSLDAMRNQHAKAFIIPLSPEQMQPEQQQQLMSTLKSYPGKVPVYIAYQNADAKAFLQLDKQWKVKVSDDLLQTFAESYVDYG